MKKHIPLLLIVVSAAAFAWLAFANNVAAVVNWWKAFAAAGAAPGPDASVGGFLPWLDWSVVDYSTVTTFIPALGLTCMAFSLARVVAGRRTSASDFPFFKGSDQLNVALGLFGTLWGIIVIGYFDLDKVSMADLMQCLHTALFSTLMAVVWVFMVDRPFIRPLFVRMLEKSGLAETDDGDLAQAVDRLVVRLGAASDSFDRRQKEYEAAFERRLAAYERECEARRKEFDELCVRRVAELEKIAADAKARAAASDAKLKSVVAAALG